MGQGQPWWLIPAIVAFSIVLFGVPGWLILQVIRWIQRMAERSHKQAFEGLCISSEPQPGDVLVVFHTYYGLIAYTMQTEYRFWASPEDARTALTRLHKSNLKWGTFSYGGMAISALSYSNLLAQQHSISKQERSRPPVESRALDAGWEVEDP